MVTVTELIKFIYNQRYEVYNQHMIVFGKKFFISFLETRIMHICCSFVQINVTEATVILLTLKDLCRFICAIHTLPNWFMMQYNVGY